MIGTATLAAGAAAFTTSSLSLGTHTVTASYGGTAGFAASTSSALTQTVQTSTRQRAAARAAGCGQQGGGAGLGRCVRGRRRRCDRRRLCRRRRRVDHAERHAECGSISRPSPKTPGQAVGRVVDRFTPVLSCSVRAYRAIADLSVTNQNLPGERACLRARLRPRPPRVWTMRSTRSPMPGR